MSEIRRPAVTGERFSTRLLLVSSMVVALILPWLLPSRPAPGSPAVEVGIVVGLVLISAVDVELARYFESRLMPSYTPAHKGLSAWAFAAAMLLPLHWVPVVVALTYTEAWWRGRRIAAWKWAGAGAFVILASTVSAQILLLGPPLAPSSLSAGPAPLLTVAAAGAAYLVVESALLWASTRGEASRDQAVLRHKLSDPAFYLTEASVLTVGTLTGVLGILAPWFVVLVVPCLGLLQQAVLRRPLAEQVDHDANTGLLRMEAWRRLALVEVARLTATGRPWAVVFADLDHFKNFNDRYGHLAGDEALAAVAEVLRTQLRRYDLVARFGGEEFCILLSDVGAPIARLVAERLAEAVRTRREGLAGPITVSLGVAVVPACLEVDLSVALALADQALYRSKMTGRDRVTAVAVGGGGTIADQPAPEPSR